MYLFECEAALQAGPAAVWAVWTDVARWPEWDVSKEIARLDGPFEPGVSGWAKHARQPGRPLRHHGGGARPALGERMPDAAGQGRLRPRARAGRHGRCPRGQEGRGRGRHRAAGPAVRPEDAPGYRRVAGRPGAAGGRGAPGPGKPPV